MTVFIATTQEDIDIEMGGSEETSESPKKGPSTLRQNLQILLQRQAKFIESCREVKVRSSLIITLCNFSHCLCCMRVSCNRIVCRL